MRHSSLLGLLLALATASAGCVGAPTRPAPGASARPKPAATAAPGAVKPAGTVPVTGPGAGLISDAGGELVSNNGGSLSGVVLAPAGLITDNGAGLIGDAGGGLITDNGAGLITDNGAGLAARALRAYGLRQAAPAAVPLANALVRVLDAAGKPLVVEGLEVTARTDAKGRYVITAELPARNLVVEAPIAAAKGALRAIAPLAPDGPRTADVDLVSSLTTAYILDRYVATQPDPVATLEKLPAAVEAATRDTARAALATGPAPTTLAPAALTAEVDALRRRDAALDRQLDTVRKLLIPAGQSDLGAGQLATEVALPAVGAILPAPDGTTWFVGKGARRVMRLGLDGRLQTVAGDGGPDASAAIAGLAGPKVTFGPIHGIGRDASGRLLILERARLSRVNADGTLAELTKTPGEILRAVVPEGADGALRVLTTASCFVLAADGTKREIGRFGAEVKAALTEATAAAPDTGGAWLLTRVPVAAKGVKLLRLDPAAGTLETRLDVDAEGLAGALLAPEGAVVEVGADFTLRLRRPGAPPEALAGAWPADVRVAGGYAAVGVDGAVYLGWRSVLHRVAGGALTRIAGIAGAKADSLGQLGITTPVGVAVAGDGSLLVASLNDNRVYRLSPDGEATTLAGTGTAGHLGDGGPAAEAELSRPAIVRVDAAGAVFISDQLDENGGQVRKIAPDGRISTFLPQRPFVFQRDFLPAPVGSSRVDLQACKLEYSIVSPK